MKFLLELTKAEVDLLEARLGTVAHDSNYDGRRVARSILKKLEAPAQGLTAAEAAAVEKAADNTLNDPDWWRDWFAPAERAAVKRGMAKLARLARPTRR